MTDKFLQCVNTFVNAMTYFIIAMGVVGGYKYFLETQLGDGMAWNLTLVFVWWIVIAGRFSQRNALRR